ncbi:MULTISPECIES: anthranilate synthase component I family protein [unclassified Sphingomonas]|uniref:anthranilate synthase component I family protein n=1 Tax=unclassified Sphingomonas TaxID=196159 RepID=UPI0006F51694|nr:MULTISPECIES: anthranilate synthase component I family protein [unclassified Sphingomonas]KQX17540.1 aminodeoxychorismate synthase component I [Sphingomonas sp. Root1294]KQY70466.1 aminodeoxychorismate synthase component I [Sphingomonas sp. Root50]KRB92209.1 aminodeoxychorismate synthase component I [Sphingomonas sp. Root720]
MSAPLPAGELAIRELPWSDPADWFDRLADRPGIAFLDSAAEGDPRSTASYIAVDAAEEIRLADGSTDDALAALRELHRPDAARGPLPFTGGLIGLLAYDLGLGPLHVAGRHRRDPELPALVVRRYDLVLGFDHRARRCWAFARPRTGVTAEARIDALLAAAPSGAEALSPPLHWIEEGGPDRHAAMIAKTLDYIAAGDIYQANISIRFVADRPPGLAAAGAYLALRRRSPAPFAAYLDLGGGCALLSASPERFVQCTADGAVETRPIKGTAPRAADPEQDRSNGARLARSSKDRAENLMICDLLRNDLSIVAEEGSVTVPQLARLEGFASVWHLVSAVRARLRPGRDAIDLIAATFPGGSITGAPKRRAMEIIDEIEDSARGPFFGMVFALGTDGAMDSSIVIRSIAATPTRLVARAGGGIVADSDPAAEYAELRAKVDPVIAPDGAQA